MEEKKKRGYKAFNKDKTNRYGLSFSPQTSYSVSGSAVFGNNGNGFHFCERLEDTLRYFDAMNGEISIAEVVGSGDIREYNDEYYGYYDMYAATELEVIRFLSRQDIIEMFRDAPWFRVIRFVQGFRLTDEEREFFKLQYDKEYKVLQAIAYYQEGKKDTYEANGGFEYLKKFNTISTD